VILGKTMRGLKERKNESRKERKKRKEGRKESRIAAEKGFEAVSV